MTIESTNIIFHWNAKMTITLKSDGTVVYGENYTPDEAAKDFWRVVEQFHPYKDEVIALRTALAKYEPPVPVLKEPENPVAAYNRAMKIIGRL